MPWIHKCSCEVMTRKLIHTSPRPWKTVSQVAVRFWTQPYCRRTYNLSLTPTSTRGFSAYVSTAPNRSRKSRERNHRKVSSTPVLRYITECTHQYTIALTKILRKKCFKYRICWYKRFVANPHSFWEIAIWKYHKQSYALYIKSLVVLLALHELESSGHRSFQKF